MATGSNSYDYIYNSSRVHYLESKMIGKEKLDILTDLPNIADVESRLSEFGIGVFSGNDKQDGNRGLETLIKDAQDTALEGIEDKSVFGLLMYKYDCENIKASVKAQILDIAPDPMLIDLGTVPAHDVYLAVKEKNYDKLPENMGKAVDEALEAYGKTGNPQLIDILIDKACFADMRSCADKGKIEFFKNYVDTLTDMTNAMICMRLISRRSNSTKALLSTALIDGGRIGKNELTAAFDAGKDKLAWLFEKNGYKNASNAFFVSDSTPAKYERAVDNELISLIREEKKKLFGAEVVGAYILAVEFEVKNLRILLAGKRAGQPSEKIRERMRDCYV